MWEDSLRTLLQGTGSGHDTDTSKAHPLRSMHRLGRLKDLVPGGARAGGPGHQSLLHERYDVSDGNLPWPPETRGAAWVSVELKRRAVHFDFEKEWQAVSSCQSQAKP